MGVKDVLFHLLVLGAAVQMRQASMTLSVSPNITAACGQSVTLHCNVSSDRGEMTSLDMFWIRNTTTLCSVHNGSPSEKNPLGCHYVNKSLSFTFRQTSQRQERTLDEYLCKVRSNQGPKSKKTWVELKECIQRVDPNGTAEGPSCSFKGVSDGEVHWYQGDTRLTDADAKFENWESVDKECCLTIIGSLRPKDPMGPYTCWLWNSQSKRRTISHSFLAKQKQSNSTAGSGMLHARWSIGNCLYPLFISMLLMSL